MVHVHVRGRSQSSGVTLEPVRLAWQRTLWASQLSLSFLEEVTRIEFVLQEGQDQVIPLLIREGL